MKVVKSLVVLEKLVCKKVEKTVDSISVDRQIPLRDKHQIVEVFNDLLDTPNNTFHKQLQLSYLKQIIKENSDITLIKLLQTLAKSNDPKFLPLQLVAKELLLNRRSLKQLVFLLSPIYNKQDNKKHDYSALCKPFRFQPN